MQVHSYKDLEIYQESLVIAAEIYTLTKKFPQDETYGMRDQIRRAVSSIGANIAEGFGRYHYKDKLLFFYNARGSLYETRHFLELAKLVGYVSTENQAQYDVRLEKLAVRLNNFIHSVGSTTNVNQ